MPRRGDPGDSDSTFQVQWPLVMTVLLLKRAFVELAYVTSIAHKTSITYYITEYYSNTRQLGFHLVVDPPPASLGYRKHMHMHSCAGRPFVPCVLRTRLHGIVNDDKFVAGATLAKRKMVAVTTVHRLSFYMGTIKFGTYQLAVHLSRSNRYVLVVEKER